jgi:hypothetical protein
METQMASIGLAQVNVDLNQSMHDLLLEIREIAKGHGIQQGDSLTEFLTKKLAETKDRFAMTVALQRPRNPGDHVYGIYAQFTAEQMVFGGKAFVEKTAQQISLKVRDALLNLMLGNNPNGPCQLDDKPVPLIPEKPLSINIGKEHVAYCQSHKIPPLVCECGGDAAGTTHSDWCPKGKK